MKDLIALVADIDIEHALRGLFYRPVALDIRPITFDIFPHPRRDPGCLLESVDFLRGFTKRYERAIVLFDHEGFGKEKVPIAELEGDLATRLASAGWNQRAAPIILIPELEIWVWSDSPQVDAALGWAARQPTLRQWLLQEKWIAPPGPKPKRPKEALHAALRMVRKVPSASIFEQLGKSVGIQRCVDPAFLKMIGFLRQWFPPYSPP